jgi:methyl-accepting chemotaxis protein
MNLFGTVIDHINRRSILTRLWVVGIVIALATSAIVAVGLYNVTQLKTAQQLNEATAIAMRNHIDRDMLHDALRSNVYQSLYSSAVKDTDVRQTLRDEMKEYSAQVARLDRLNRNLPVAPAIKKSLQQSGLDFEPYVQQANEISRLALSDGGQATQLLPAFLVRFSALEKSQRAITDQLQAELLTDGQLVRDRLSSIKTLFIFAAFSILILTIALVSYLRAQIVQPVIRITKAISTQNPASDSITERDQSRADEIGMLAASVVEFRTAVETARKADDAARAADEAAREAEQRARVAEDLAAREREQSRAKGEAHRKAALLATADQLDQRVSGITKLVRDTTVRLKTIARELSHSAEQSSVETTAAAAAARQTLTGVITIAEATDELAVSINEISARIGDVAASGDDARGLANAAEGRMATMREMADRIGYVTNLIADLAKQTNLLALNATIEASRAGEAGRGFSVVANEIKQLAQQTRGAVSEVDEQIKSILGATGNVGDSMASVAEAIDNLSNATTSIATAADQQSMATGEISRTIQQAAAGTDIMQNSLLRMDAQINETATNARVVADVADDLDRHAGALGDEIADFIAKAKAV